MSRFRLITFLCALLALGLAAPAYAHDHGMGGPGATSSASAGSDFRNMTKLESDPAPETCRAADRTQFQRCINSDVAFWGDLAVVGDYGGFRIYDISDPENPDRISSERCWGPQNDPSLWDTDNNGAADLLVLSVDRTLAGPACEAVEPQTPRPHDDPSGWEGLRFFDISDPTDPTFIRGLYQDCGSHTNTLYKDPNAARNRLLVLNSSYPLRPGPTCGEKNAPSRPYHGVIQAVQIPLLGSAAASANAASEVAELPINYPGDPDNVFDPAEHQLPGFGKLRACHDIAVYLPDRKVVGACAEQSQMWKLGPDGLPQTSNREWVFDQPNIDFHHSATLTWDGKIVNVIDESFGSGCPTVTKGVGQTGRMFFLKAGSGEKLSHFMIKRHKKEDPDYCSAHLGNFVPSSNRYLLVNAWYTGGVDVIDASNPRSPREVAYYDDKGDNWSAYWYEQNGTSATGPFNVFATHGVEDPPNGEGFQALTADVPVNRTTLGHLNPQVQEIAVAANVSKAARKSSRARTSRVARERNSGKVSRRKVARRLAP